MVVFVDARGAFLYRGGFLLAALAAAAGRGRGADRRASLVLSVRPLVLIGVISYGLYSGIGPLTLRSTRAEPDSTVGAPHDARCVTFALASAVVRAARAADPAGRTLLVRIAASGPGPWLFPLSPRASPA